MNTVPHQATIDALHLALRAEGLSLRGGFAPTAEDAVPPLPDGRAAAWACMVGNVGSGFWPLFKLSPEFSDGQPDPLDRWTQRIGEALARQWGGVALFPFRGPPYLPFQQWALRSEPLQRSPLGLLIDPDHGLWHAFRFALALPTSPAAAKAKHLGRAGTVKASTESPSAGRVPSALSDICTRCDGQPCLHTCPVQAFTGTAYKVDDCAAWLRQPSGQDCMSGGCQARRACPVGTAWRYEDEHAAFHMAAFVGKHPG